MSDLSRELEALDPTLPVITLKDGLDVEVLPLDTLQLIKLIKIFVNGSPANSLVNALFGGMVDDDPELFTAGLVMNLVMSIPNAEAEVLEFLRFMVRPAGLASGRKLSREEQATNGELQEAFNRALANPKVEDTVDIITAVITNNADDLRSLGKKLTFLMGTIFKGHQPSQSQ